jgi:hypothetical protein
MKKLYTKKKKPSKKAVTQLQPQTLTSNGSDPEKEQAIQAIRLRCDELIRDAKGIAPGLRIVGVFGLHTPYAEQTVTSRLCRDVLAVTSQKLTEDEEVNYGCACDGEEFMCEDCRAELIQILKQQEEELAAESLKEVL